MFRGRSSAVESLEKFYRLYSGRFSTVKYRFTRWKRTDAETSEPNFVFQYHSSGLRFNNARNTIANWGVASIPAFQL
jgi:hypothetical protein